jgi:hypothetical protein
LQPVAFCFEKPSSGSLVFVVFFLVDLAALAIFYTLNSALF